MSTYSLFGSHPGPGILGSTATFKLRKYKSPLQSIEVILGTPAILEPFPMITVKIPSVIVTV